MNSVETQVDTKAAVIAEIGKIADEMVIRELPPLTDDLVFTDSGLDSLAIAILVTRLEERLGVDPFSESAVISYPVTLGELIQLYENSAKNANAVPGQDR
jgi:acyl carrier protein